MTELTPSGRALVQAGKQADRPRDADRERVLAALRVRLGDAALLATDLAHAPPAANAWAVSRSRFVKWGIVGPTVLVAGALWLVPRLSHHEKKAVAAPSASTLSVEAKPVDSVAPVLEVAPSPSGLIASPASSRGVDGQKASLRSRDGLAEEVALLSRAETELRAGRPAKALLVLGEHQRKFPHGTLAEERTAARIQALCALGRNDEANAQLTQLLHISPNSAHQERARQACRDATP